MATRPDLARLRLQSEAAHKFAYAERDLARPNVTVVGAAGLLSYSSLPTPLPDKYEGVAVNVDVPVFNGGLFGARHAAAEYRARAADQTLRDYRGRRRRVTCGWRGPMPRRRFSGWTSRPSSCARPRSPSISPRAATTSDCRRSSSSRRRS